MNSHHGSKSMNTLIRLQQNTKNDDNVYNEEDNSNEEKHKDYDYHATILKNNNIKTNTDEEHTMKETTSTNEDDLYAPLSPEEADEDQLAEFFTGLDVSFLQGEGVICHATKRRRLLQLSDEDSSLLLSLCSSSYSIDTDDDVDNNTEFVLQRKHRNLLLDTE